MTKIKICGIQTKKEIEMINEFVLDIDYIGLIFAPSKRKVDLKKAKSFLKVLDKRIKKVGVFVDEDLENINKIKKILDLDIIQCHGQEKNKDLKKINGKVWKAISIKDKSSLKKIKKYSFADNILLDNKNPGSGEKFDWDILKESKFKDFILAGGLNPKNVKTAIKNINPKIVDVSSGVQKGKYKDKNLIKKFIRSVKDE
ncbi:MAG: phosphoribosylanthranilate isomerase [Bacillota bacterium]